MFRCFSTLGCPDYSLDNVLSLARTAAIAGVELRALGGTVDLPGYLTAAYGSPGRLTARMTGEAVKIVALNTSLELAGSSEKEWADTLESFLPWAEALGGVRLRVFDGGIAGQMPDVVGMSARMAWWREWRRHRGWRSDVMIETHGGLCSAATVRPFLAASPGTAILWDTHHTWKCGGEDPVMTWRALAPDVVHLHVKDSVTSRSAPGDHGYVLPGEGEFPMGSLLRALGSDYGHALSLEWERLWHPELPSLESALSSATQHGWW